MQHNQNVLDTVFATQMLKYWGGVTGDFYGYIIEEIPLLGRLDDHFSYRAIIFLDRKNNCPYLQTDQSVCKQKGSKRG
jgi:hypothetical protein